MSLATGFDLCRAALAATDTTAPEQAVLMVLAIMADKDAQCWPGVTGANGLTAKTKLGERTIRRALHGLRDKGHVTIKEVLGKGNLYTVHPCRCGTSAAKAPCQNGTPAAVAVTPAAVAPKPPVTTISVQATPSQRKRAPKAPAFVPPSDIPEAEWEAFEEMRRRIGKPMTAKARELAVTRLRNLAEDGYPPGAVLNHSILNNYQGLFPPKDHRNEPVRSSRGAPPPRVDGFGAALVEMGGYSAADYRH